MFPVCLLLLLILAVQIRGSNIMLNKPTIQSSSWDSNWASSLANDGNTNNNPSHTLHEKDPYWQGDLLGFYKIHNISVTSHNSVQALHLQGAFIGVSAHDLTCPDDNVTLCGQWPNSYNAGQTHVYTCPNAGPARFVRIWRQVANDGLAISEVEVEGEPRRLTGGTVYDKVLSKKVNTPTSSFTVGSVTGCANLCHGTQPCIAFSYSASQQPDCLLATDSAMTQDVMWINYKIRKCFHQSICDISDYF